MIDINKINLNIDFNTFCESQENCRECKFTQYELVNNAYDQPCAQVYDLLKLLKK